MITDKLKNKITGSVEEFIYKNLLTKMTYYVELNMNIISTSCVFEEVIRSIIPLNRLNHDLWGNNCEVKSSTEYDWVNLIWYRGCPLLFKSSHKINTDRDKNEVFHDESFNIIRIYTLHNKKCKDSLIDFIRKSKKIREIKTYNKTKKDVFVYNKNNKRMRRPQNGGYIVKRTFDDLFMTDQQQTILVKHLNGFVNKREWYRENRIPYHFGILLYGVPGSGKTVVAQAIASHISAQFISITGEELSLLNNIINEMHHGRDYRHPIVLLIDDIDVSSIIKNRQSSSSKQEISLLNDEASGFGNVLSILDGIDAMENIIYVFTTNHLEDIDPALIRPGRIDITMEIGYVCKETLNQFFNKHFNDDLPDDLIVRDGLTFAKLQTLVMTDISKEDFIEYVKEKE